MNSSLTPLHRPIRFSSLPSFANPKPFTVQPRSSTSPSPKSPIQRCFSRFSSQFPSRTADFPLEASGIRVRVRDSSRDVQPFTSGSFRGDEEELLREPSFTEFITSERVKVVAMLALALALCNADRVVMSVAIVPLSLVNGWRQSFAGVVQSSFLWGYLISPIAGGTLVDYYGGKVVMAWGVALWSLATFLTPWAAETSLWALLAMRVLLGVAEGVALPCMNNMIARWFPQTERSRAVGLAMAGFQLGSAIGLTLSPILMSQGGLFGPFVMFGLSGFLWLLVWLSATSSTPDRSPQISKFELEYICNKGQKSFVENKKTTKVIPPFRRLLSKWPTWSVIVANSMHSWGFFVILSWMPIYFKTIYHVDLRQAAWFSAVPWSMMALVGYFAGVLSDMLIQRGLSVTLTRKIMQSIGFIGPGIALIGLTMAKSPAIASAWLTLAVGLKSFSHCGFLVNLQEISPQYSGVLHGLSNTAGTFAAILGTVGAGFFVELVGSFKGFLLLTSLLYFSAALFWNLFSTGIGTEMGLRAPLHAYYSKSLSLHFTLSAQHIGPLSIGFIGPGIALIGLTMAKSPAIASAWLTLAVGLKSFSHCGFLVNLQEISPQYSGVLHGLSNTAGTFAAILGTVGAGFFVELVGSFKGFLLLTSLLYFSAALFWNLFSTGERVNFDESE